ncbi:MAG: hypothetical protein RJA41_777 [Actinomycetota bacterium]
MSENEAPQSSQYIQLDYPTDGLPEVIESDSDLANACIALRSGDGPIAIDAERASSFRYTARAYLIQIRRNNAGTFLIDPLAISDFSQLAEIMASVEWVLHAATQDLACLAELTLVPQKLFDTEHAGRLLGRQRVGLQALLETEMNLSLAKEHSAADWSTRPLPEPWLIYAALDVEKLIELREILLAELSKKNRLHWAEQDFAHLATWKPNPVPPEPWRKTSGIHKVRNPRQLAIVREIWLERDRIARERDKSVSKVLPDAAIIDIAKIELKNPRDLFMLESLRNRSHKSLADHWWQVRQNAISLTESELPKASTGLNPIPPTKAWEEKNPEAHSRFSKIRPKVIELAENFEVAPEIIISPDVVRQLCWNGYESISNESELQSWLLSQKVRHWQTELLTSEVFELLFS